jgi:NAD(P)-dependent dehydrogenase (short-subunit alcohol dehydrogenase family)
VLRGELIVKKAIDTFGRLDILINNAGFGLQFIPRILRDKSFSKLTNEEWNIIQEVHLKGAYKTTKAAWEYFNRQKFGRIIMTISAAGLYGNPGQVNYGAGKIYFYHSQNVPIWPWESIG